MLCVTGMKCPIIIFLYFFLLAVFDIKKSTMTQSVTYELEFCSHVLSYHHLPISVLAPVSSKYIATIWWVIFAN